MNSPLIWASFLGSNHYKVFPPKQCHALLRDLTSPLLGLGPSSKSLWSNNIHLSANRTASFCWTSPLDTHPHHPQMYRWFNVLKGMSFAMVRSEWGEGGGGARPREMWNLILDCVSTQPKCWIQSWVTSILGNKTANTSLNKLLCLCAVRGIGKTECVNVSK